MSKQVLDVQQMLHLREMGLELKETTLIYAGGGGKYGLFLTRQIDKILWESTYPAYTLQDVLDALPRFVIDDEGNKYYLQIEMMNTEFDDWRVSYKSVGQDESPLGYFQAFQLIDAAVRMLVLCYEEGYVETNKNE